MFWPAFFASALMLPLLMLDIIRVSHRFAGPMIRIRKALRDVAEGKTVEPIRFRFGDFWCDVAEDFNRATARIRESQMATRTEGGRRETPAEKVSDNTVAV
jgi:hypothetical protein